MISTALRQATLPEQGNTILRDPRLKLKYRRIQLFDKEWVDVLLKAEDSLSSAGCFGTLYLWGEAYGLRIAKLGNRLLSQYQSEDGPAFGYPMGSGDLQVAILAMRQAAAEAGVPLVLTGLTEAQKEKLENVFRGHFSFTETRDTADYIYEAQKLATLSGNKLHSKKNHCNQFIKRNPDWRFEVLTKEHFADCRVLLNQWEAAQKTVTTDEQEAEPIAIEKAFAAYDELGLDGGILYVGEQPVAFTFGERVGQQGFDVRFEKADTSFDGSYTMVNREFVRSLLERYPDLQYINREEDMGLENLRKAKQSYKPVMLLKKYDAIWED
jgi:hypothetical protein